MGRPKKYKEITINCPVCGKQFTKKENDRKKTCSRKCANRFLSQLKDKGNTSICQQCGKEFHHKPSKQPKYCSRECKHKAQSGRKEYKIDLDLDEIKRLYLEELKSAEEIAKRLETTKKNILLRLNDLGIVRESGEGKSLYFKRNPDKFINNLPGVKEKQKQALINYHSQKGEERRKEWVAKISNSLKNLTPEARVEQLRKSYETKYKNGTLYQSLMEKEVSNFIKSNVSTRIIENSYDILKSKELDIYLPDYKLAIEFNGLFWHSEGSKKDKNYHLHKTQLCEEKSIQLIHIFEDEWIEKKDIVKSIIKGKLGLNDKIYARKCEIKEIENKEAKSFYERNHIQGSINSKINIGLFYENKLVSCLSFNKARYNKQYDWEITRFANKLDISIIGGFAKMLSYFKKHYNGSIITYSDRRYFNGSIYKNNGFKELKESQPNYFYTDYKFRYSRIKFQKHKLEEQLEYFDPQLTEWENMQLNGWDRIWDCGNRVFIK
ncbi:MAG: hypothetical protein ACOCP4_07110 [Candidatus Woesearchaeota archaeon]